MIVEDRGEQCGSIRGNDENVAQGKEALSEIQLDRMSRAFLGIVRQHGAIGQHEDRSPQQRRSTAGGTR